MDVRQNIPTRINWNLLSETNKEMLTTSLNELTRKDRNLTILHLMESAQELRNQVRENGKEVALRVIEALQPISLPDSLADRFYNTLESAGIINQTEHRDYSRFQRKEMITFNDALELGFEKKMLEIYLRSEEAVQEVYREDISQRELFAIGCRQFSQINAEQRNALYNMLIRMINSNVDLVQVSPETKRSPLEDYIDDGGDIRFLMCRVNLERRENLTTRFRDIADPEFYMNIDRGELIYMLSVPSFWQNVIECCISKVKNDNDGNNTQYFPFLYDSVMKAFAYYLNHWIYQYMEDQSSAEEKVVFENVLTALQYFTPDQQKAFFHSLEKSQSEFIKKNYKEKNKEILRNRLSPLLRQCSTIFNQPNASPLRKDIHTYPVEGLQQAASNTNYTPEQRLTALHLFSKTGKFQDLTAEERIAYFTGICNAASNQIGSIRKLVDDLQNELVWNGDYLEETTKNLRTIQSDMFTIIQKTREEAQKQLPQAFSTNKNIHEEFTEARQERPFWDALYGALQMHFNNEMDSLSTLDIDYEDLMKQIFEVHKCSVESKAIVELFIKLDIKVLSDLNQKLCGHFSKLENV